MILKILGYVLIIISIPLLLLGLIGLLLFMYGDKIGPNYSEHGNYVDALNGK
jgi:multisubunit Na+/H+ antiporter MnhG subunit